MAISRRVPSVFYLDLNKGFGESGEVKSNFEFVAHSIGYFLALIGSVIAVSQYDN